MNKFFSLAFAFLIFFSVNASEDANIFSGNEANQIAANSNLVRMKTFTSIPNYVQFIKGKELPINKLQNWLLSYYKTDDNFGLKLLSVENDELGFTHYRYQQTINTFPVRLGMYNVHTKNGLIYSMNGELFDNSNMSTQSFLSENTALFKALNHINAQLYKWEIPDAESHLKWEQDDPTTTYYPKGELVFVNESGIMSNSLKLTYVFNIYAQEPLSRKEIYVDAKTGTIVWEENKLHDADVVGTAATGYSGTKTMTSDNTGTNYRLRETGRGNGIRTFNNQNTTTYSNTDFTNATANWTTFNPTVDRYATDAHWGAEMTYDYYFIEHNRNSINNSGFQLNSYVHHDNNYNNAFWDGQRMTYGDGSNNSAPLTAVDIAGHEITHGLTSFTANLVYQAESGALNESFSDIFGNTIEKFARPTQNSWLLGEDLGNAFRNMQNPKLKNDPDTYFGQYWASLTGGDNGGVHTNSGVQNKWYVLLADGGSGTNDNSDVYNVTGQGIVKAGKIAFRNLTVYLTSSSQFADARFYAIQSAVDLYGGCTSEVEATTNAWYAVGVGSAYAPFTVSDFSAPVVNSCSAPFTVSFNNTSVNGSTFIWHFGDGTTSTQLNPTHTYTTVGTFNVSLVADGGASCGQDSVYKSAFITIDPNLPCITILPANGTANTQTACLGKIFDSGGASADYGANETSQITISPIGASSVTLNFISFDIEAGTGTSCNYDYLNVYDGANTSSTLIGTYCNNNIPTTISSTGGSITILFSSDGGVENAGFEIDWVCVQSNQPPTADFTSNIDTTCTGEIQFYDNSTNGPTSWLWNFGDGNTSPLQNPTHIYGASGTYNVQLTATNGNGNDVEIKSNFITVNLPASPTVTGDVICENNTASLSASGSGTLNWYNVASGGTPINTGLTFTTPALSSTTTYYVEAITTAPIQNAGKPNNTGGGANFNNQQHLIFDALAQIEIVSVEVYSGANSVRTIELRSSTNAILDSRTVTIGSGQQTVPLNFIVPIGTGYQLGMAAGSNIDLYRNNGGTNYPYTTPGLVSITSSSAGTSYYYFFYNWQVKGSDCISAREPVTATVTPNPIVDAGVNQTICEGIPVTLTASNPNGAIITWDNGVVDGVSFLPGTGTITYTVTADLNGCISTDQITITVTICTGLGEFSNGSIVTSYFNPSNNNVELSLTNLPYGNYTAIIVNTLGQLINEEQIFVTSSNQLERISLATNSKGLYILKLINSSNNYTSKFVMQ